MLNPIFANVTAILAVTVDFPTPLSLGDSNDIFNARDRVSLMDSFFAGDCTVIFVFIFAFGCTSL